MMAFSQDSFFATKHLGTLSPGYGDNGLRPVKHSRTSFVSKVADERVSYH